MPAHLNDVARAIGVHPRTVLRAVTQESHPYWTAHYDPSLRIADVAVAFRCDRHALAKLIRTGKPPLLDQVEAAEYVGMSLRYFRKRNYKPFIHCGHKVIRYTKGQCEQIRNAWLAANL